MEVVQLQIPLFPDGMFDKIRQAYHLQEVEKLQKEIAHLKHQRAGHIGAYNKLKKQKDDHDKEKPM